MVAKTGKKNTKIEESSREDQFVVLLENMRDEIKLVAEGNLMLQESMERGFGEVKREISNMKTEMNDIKTEMNDMKTEMNDMKTEMRMGFKGMMAESVAIDKKMEKKADKKDLLILEKRVARLESVR
jgi:pyridoxal biosynthesis lyase PdxS